MIKHLFSLLFIFVLSLPMLGQTQALPVEVKKPAAMTEAEIKTFVDVYIQHQEIEREHQLDMVSAIENEGITLDAFQKIYQEMQTGAEPTASIEEIDKFKSSLEKLNGIQDKMIEAITQMVEDKGLTIEKYEAMIMAINSNPENQQKVQELLMTKMQERQEG